MFFGQAVGNWFGCSPPIRRSTSASAGCIPRFQREDYRAAAPWPPWPKSRCSTARGTSSRTCARRRPRLVASVGPADAATTSISARRLLESLPPRLREALRSAAGSRSGCSDALRRICPTGAGEPARGEVQALARAASSALAYHLPLIELALPAVKAQPQTGSAIGS